MNAKEANKVSIQEFLKRKGILPKRRYPGYLMYRVPWRNENRPSMKVDLQKNLWIDYATREGGTLIDLIQKMDPHLSVKDAIQEINRSHSLFSFQQQKFEDLTSGINIEEVKPIGTNPALTNYLLERGINLETAKPFCSEIYFKVKGKPYFGIGHKSENGWHIRNKYWKGCTGQGITCYQNGSKQVVVFEGIFDILSYQQMNKFNSSPQDLLILNSTVNLKRGIELLKGYVEINLFLDNDEAGNKATQMIIDAFPFSQDKREIYKNFKDLNAYHVSRMSTGKKITSSPEASHVLVRPKRLHR
jgi:5S rRNA maturation endonuclease (ribonuclease M5)